MCCIKKLYNREKQKPGFFKKPGSVCGVWIAYAGTQEPVGQTSAQEPQSLHFAGSMT
jgi:hypothetical protein